MNTVRILYHLARADFLERVRRYSFLLTLAATVYLGYAVIVDDVKLRFGDYRGVNNSAWVGLQMAMCATIFVSLAGFYVVKNTVDRDIQTRVGQILATTPIDKLDYLFGKGLSNLAVMAVIVLVLAVAAVVGQFWAGQDLRVELWPLLAPFLLIALPALAFVAALAVFFETLPGLRGGFGNVMYFFLWIFLLAYGPEAHNAFADCLGFGLLESYMKVGLYAQLPDYHGGMGIGILAGLHSYKSFLWEGFAWRIDLVSMRLYWFALALGLILLAAAFFDRFDPARGLFRDRAPSPERTRRHLFSGWRERRAKAITLSSSAPANGAGTLKTRLHLPPLDAAPAQPRSGTLLLAELRLMLKGQRWWWYAGAAGLLIAALASPAESARQDLLPWIWLWPVLLWSAMGTREARHQTDQLIFSAAYPVRRQFPAMWLAGVIVALLTGAGVALRVILAGDWAGLLGLSVGAIFIPTLALAFGVWSGTSKLFEVVYTIWWYAGPLNHVPGLDFMFTSPKSFSDHTLWSYLAATVVLFGCALLGRKRQIQV
jgi:hypothetical protein